MRFPTSALTVTGRRWGGREEKVYPPWSSFSAKPPRGLAAGCHPIGGPKPDRKALKLCAPGFHQVCPFIHGRVGKRTKTLWQSLPVAPAANTYPHSRHEETTPREVPGNRVGKNNSSSNALLETPIYGAPDVSLPYHSGRRSANTSLPEGIVFSRATRMSISLDTTSTSLAPAFASTSPLGSTI